MTLVMLVRVILGSSADHPVFIKSSIRGSSPSFGYLGMGIVSRDYTEASGEWEKACRVLDWQAAREVGLISMSVLWLWVQATHRLSQCAHLLCPCHILMMRPLVLPQNASPWFGRCEIQLSSFGSWYHNGCWGAFASYRLASWSPRG